jgi:DNA-binding transcriptional LysR family regulator
MENTDLNDLRCFAIVSQTRSFTAAAKRLRVPKSSVSRSIRRLESRLGVLLLQRTTRTVALTEPGQLYLARCQRVMEEIEQADLAVGALLAVPHGKLRVGAPVPFVRTILAPMLSDFLAKYPRIDLDLQFVRGEERLEDNDFDVIIRAGKLSDSSLLFSPLLQIPLGVYASPGYLKGRAAPHAPFALREHACVAVSCNRYADAGLFTTWHLRRGAETVDVRLRVRAAVPDPAMNHELALSGAGVAMVAQWMVRADLEKKRLVRLLPEWEPEPVQLNAVYPTRLSSSPKVRAFLEFVRERRPEHVLALL